jgi:hypothetical protein
MCIIIDLQGNVIGLTVVIRPAAGQGGKYAGYRKLGYQAVGMDQPQDSSNMNEKQYVAYWINNSNNNNRCCNTIG